MVRLGPIGRPLAGALAALLAGTLAAAEDAAALLRATAARYASLESFELQGVMSSPVAETATDMRMTFTLAMAGPKRTPAGSGVPMVPLSAYTSLDPTCMSEPACMGALEKAGTFSPPSVVLDVERLAVDVATVVELPAVTLPLDGGPVRLRGLEVRYARTRHGTDEVFRYWIDPAARLVRRVELAGPGAPSRRWTATITKVTLDAAPPDWALASAQAQANVEIERWIGQAAPDIEVRDLAGKPLSLRALRGQVVVLAFWATWCGPCKEEMPVLERLRDELGASVSFLGLAGDAAEPARAWLKQHGRTLRSAADATAVFEAYGVDLLPVIAIVDRVGTIVSYTVGLRSEEHLRAAIRAALVKKEAR